MLMVRESTQPVGASPLATTPAHGEHPRKGTRTCAGCGARVAKERRHELIHLILMEGEHGLEPVVNLAGKRHGRGAWVHPSRACLERACARGLARSAKAPVRADAEGLVNAIRVAAVRRLLAQIAAGCRAGRVSVGGSRAAEAWSKKKAALIIVARDAAASAQLPFLAAAEECGRLAVWGEKTQLGGAVGRNEVGVLAVCDSALAAGLADTLYISDSLDLNADSAVADMPSRHDEKHNG